MDLQKIISEMTDEDYESLFYDFDFWARAKQHLPPGDWRWALYTCGRGWGKTFCGAGNVVKLIMEGKVRNVGLITLTPTDAENVMINGDSGIMSRCPPGFTPKYNSVNKILKFPNGAKCFVGSGADPKKLRGKQFDFVWVDELFHFDYPDDTWAQLEACMRLKGPTGEPSRGIITTTPIVTALAQELYNDNSIVKVNGSIYENDTLDAKAVASMTERFKGTSLERQELYGELVTSSEGAPWNHDLIRQQRLESLPSKVVQTFIGVDPSISGWGQDRDNNKRLRHDEIGILVAVICEDDNLYIITDHSGRYPVPVWRDKILDLVDVYENPTLVVEKNQGGDMIMQMFADGDKLQGKARKLQIVPVTARQGKILRAQPIAIAYERKRIFHVGEFPALEMQMCSYTGHPKQPSPDRLDALVWACTLALNNLRNYAPSTPLAPMEWTPARDWT